MGTCRTLHRSVWGRRLPPTLWLEGSSWNRSAYVVTRRMGCSWPGQEHGERILDTVYRCAKMPRWESLALWDKEWRLAGLQCGVRGGEETAEGTDCIHVSPHRNSVAALQLPSAEHLTLHLDFRILNYPTDHTWWLLAPELSVAAFHTLLLTHSLMPELNLSGKPKS